MKTLTILLIGLILLGWAGTAGLRAWRVQRRRDQKLAGRLEALRPDDGTVGSARTLFGPETGPRFLRVRLARAGLHIERRAAILGLLAILVGGGLIVWLNQPALALFLIGFAVGGAWLALEFIAARRTAALVRELPFLLDGVRQHLTVGASMHQGLTRAVEQAGAEIKSHFLPVLRRMQNGATVVESLSWLAVRLEVAEIDMLATAVQTNTRFGGAMSPTLANLSQILRDRQRVGRELKSATAETRFSGWIVASMPIIAMLVIGVLNPAYREFLTTTATGHHMLTFAACCQVGGTVIMARIMRLDF